MDNLNLIVILVALGIGIVSILWTFLMNHKVVEPNNRERLVIQDVLTGSMKVLGPGTHFPPPWWKDLERVDLNREPKETIGQEFKTADGVLGLVDFRFDMISGRAYDPVSGRLLDPDGIDNTERSVSEEVILQAVTRIDYADREQRVSEIASAVIESELGSYTSDQAFRTAQTAAETLGGFFYVPTQAVPSLGLNTHQVRNAHDLYEALSKSIEAKINKELTFVGINIVGFRITNLKPKSPAFQESLEIEPRTRRHEAAARDMVARAGADANISYREALVATNPDALGQVATAEATVESAAAIGEAIKVGAQALAEGLKNFGKS